MTPPPDEHRLAEESLELYPFARSLVGDPDLAADLVQDTFVRALERRDTYRGGSLRAWLRTILHRLAIDRSRRSAHELLTDEVDERWHDDGYTVDAQVVAERALDREALQDALVRLPYDHRIVVLLADHEGLTGPEVAEALGISLPAAKQRLRRGRMMLVSALAAGDERRHLLEGVPMRCWDARRHVSDYLDGQLDPETATFVEAHLERCPTCPPLVASLVDVAEQLGSARRDPDSVIPTALRARLRDRVADRRRSPVAPDR